MTEHEWLTSGDPLPMLRELRHQVSDRKLRWFAVACVRFRQPAKFTKFHWDVVAELEEAIDQDEPPPAPEWLLGGSLEGLLLVNAFYSAHAVISRSPGGVAERLRAEAVQCALLRDIFGNPFRPVLFAPSSRLTARRSPQSVRPRTDGEWRTDTAVAIATHMYEARDFSAMPILADALQDAGCEDEQVLTHCRDATVPHVRGCWVVDLVLGK